VGKSIEDGLGIRHFTGVKDPIALARFIRAQGGLAVVSHPSRYGYEIPPALVGEIDGIEVWTASNDSRFVPDGKVIDSPEARQVVLSGEDGGAGNFIVSNRYLRVGGDRPPRLGTAQSHGVPVAGSGGGEGGSRSRDAGVGSPVTTILHLIETSGPGGAERRFKRSCSSV